MKDDVLSDEDKKLFRQAVDNIKPDHKLKASRENLNRPAPIYDLSSYYTSPVQSGTFLSWSCAGLPARRLSELKQGDIPIEGRLDMHGIKTDVAALHLADFIHQHVSEQHRCVLIIHGKGGKSGEAPVLKNLVNHWLPQFPEVLAFCSAASKHGGTGALYVLLKRKKA